MACYLTSTDERFSEGEGESFCQDLIRDMLEEQVTHRDLAPPPGHRDAEVQCLLLTMINAY